VKRRRQVAQAYQCDKCQTFYTDTPYSLIVRFFTLEFEEVVLEKDLCAKCLEEIKELFQQDRWRRL
jgi:hypothetical protein